MLRILYVCRSVDESDTYTGVQATWIRALAEHPDVASVHVLTRVVGPSELPANVTLRTFGHGRGRAYRFLREVVRLPRPWPDAFVITQGGPWPLLLFPFKAVARRPLLHWLAQPVLSRRARAAARWCDDIVFTATKGSLPSLGREVRVLGHGIDTDRFRPSEAPSSRDVLLAGRISPGKRVKEAVEAVVAARTRFGVTCTLEIAGTASRDNKAYLAEVHALVDQLDATEQVRFLGAVPYQEMPELVAQFRLALNLSKTALDKAVVEAMAAGVPVLSTNPNVAEILPPDLREQLVTAEPNSEELGRRIAALVSLDGEPRRELSERLRSIAVSDHSVEHLIDQIVRAAGERARR